MNRLARRGIIGAAAGAVSGAALALTLPHPLWGFLLGLGIGALPVYDYMTDPRHFVHRVPSAVLAAALMILSFFSLGLGLILNSMNLRLLEIEKLIAKR